ncbi:unnamed protein product [Pleuronectes platessa]|uniref:Uncharacterized protein n=1 Tax=Pleuronectes platessa TaxID=8262 RepID=A0A9N7VUH3_PLEPL|nr:unnamed protein product [Pleuronectes platessa]
MANRRLYVLGSTRAKEQQLCRQVVDHKKSQLRCSELLLYGEGQMLTESSPEHSSESPDSAVNHNTNQGGAGPHGIGRGDESRVGLLLRQKLKMDNKSIKRPGGAEKHREKKLKSLEVEAAKCAKLTDLFGASSPAQQQQVRRETSEEDSTMMSEWRQTW